MSLIIILYFLSYYHRCDYLIIDLNLIVAIFNRYPNLEVVAGNMFDSKIESSPKF